MRMVAQFEDESQARRFGDYLVTLGMANTVEEGREGWLVWVHDEGNLERAGHEFETFRENPDDPRFNARKEAGDIRREQEQAAERRRRNIIRPREAWVSQTRSLLLGGAGTKTRGLTLALIIVTVGVGIATKLYYSGPTDTSRALVFNLPKIEHGEIWRLFTPMFLHFGILHLVFNLMWLRYLGAMIEASRGTLVLAGLVFGSSLVSNLAQYAWAGPNFGGLSGVLFALFGYVLVKQKFQPALGMLIPRSTAVFLIIWLVLCMTGVVGYVANAAHVSGLFVGLAIGWLGYRFHQWRSS